MTKVSMDWFIDCDVGGRDCRALSIVWRGIAESKDDAFLRCLRTRCSPKEGSWGKTVRFSIDDEVLMGANESLGVAAAGNGVEDAGAPPISAVATGVTLSFTSRGQ
jgi:hypothetical protein